MLTEDRCEVSITLTSPMDEPMDRTHVTDAVVELRDLSSGHESLSVKRTLHRTSA